MASGGFLLHIGNPRVVRVRICLVNHWVLHLTCSTETHVIHTTREQVIATGESAVRAWERLCEARETLLQAQTRP